jgi:hypothetical protein
MFCENSRTLVSQKFCFCKNFATTYVFAKFSAQKVRKTLITIIFYLKIKIFRENCLNFCFCENFARIFIIFATFGKLFANENFPFETKNVFSFSRKAKIMQK